MRTGKVKWFNHKSKFGFIIDDETKEEYYVPAKAVEGKINTDDIVQFELKEAKRGKECINVKAIEP
jgi:CspA family cold shock protein